MGKMKIMTLLQSGVTALLLTSCADGSDDSTPAPPDGNTPAKEPGDVSSTQPGNAPAGQEGVDRDGRALQNEPIPECLFDLKPLAAGAVTSTGIAASGLIELVKSGAAQLTWADGSRTELSVSVSGPRYFEFTSTKNPEHKLENDHCMNGARVEADVRLSTADGRVNISTVLKADVTEAEPTRARANASVRKDAFPGAYVPASVSAQQCVVRSQLALEFTSTGLKGQVIEAIAEAACDELADATAVGPRYVGSW